MNNSKVTNRGGLARELGLGDKRIRQLEDLGVVIREPGEGPAQYAVALNCRRYAIYRDHDGETAARDVQEAAGAVDDALEQLHNEPDLERRRTLGIKIGCVVGQLDRAMRLGSALAPEHARLMMETQTRMCVGHAASAIMDACSWRLEEQPEPESEAAIAE